jgi:hypothetical protein
MLPPNQSTPRGTRAAEIGEASEVDGGIDGIAQFGALNHAIDDDACDAR